MTRPDYLLFLALLAFAPLAFGTVEPWSLAIMETSAFTALAFALRRRTFDGALRLTAVPGALPLALFIGFVLLQATPLPPNLVRVLSPAAFATWSSTLGIARPLPWVSLSLAPVDTLGEAARFGAYAAVYVLAVQLLRRRERLRATAIFLAVFAAVLAFLALVQSAAAPTRLLLLRAAPFDTRPFGPYVNRNHFANLMAMLTPVLLALFLLQPPGGVGRTLRERLASLVSRPGASARILLGFATLLAATSLAVSLSRGAMVAVSAALLLFGTCLVAQGLGARRTVSLVLLAGLFALFTGWFGWARVAERFAEARGTPLLLDRLRPLAWHDTLRMALEFPLLGSGVGAFARVYPRYRSIPGSTVLTHAHSDWLELFAGAGALGFLLFAWFVATVVRSSLRTLRERRDPAARFLTLGAVAGVVAFLVHGASDFSLALGANGLYFFLLLGLAVSASHTREREGEDASSLLPRAALPSALSAAAVALALAAALAWTSGLEARHSWRLAGEQAASAAATTEGARRPIALAARLDPLDPRYQAALARLDARSGDLAAAVRGTSRALRRAPTDGETLRQLGIFLSRTGADDGAGKAFAAAVAFGPTDALNRMAYGSWLIARGERSPGADQLGSAVALDPARLPEVIALLVVTGFSDREIGAVVPEQPEALLGLARYLEKTGAATAAGETYRRVLKVAPGDPRAVQGLRLLSPAR